MELVKFDHHGKEVSAMKHLQGKHKEHCLCWVCNKLTPEDHENNCKIANLLFNVNKVCEITTPVFYCAQFEEKRPD